jgi:hypothetical protein
MTTFSITRLARSLLVDWIPVGPVYAFGAEMCAGRLDISGCADKALQEGNRRTEREKDRRSDAPRQGCHRARVQGGAAFASAMRLGPSPKASRTPITPSVRGRPPAQPSTYQSAGQTRTSALPGELNAKQERNQDPPLVPFPELTGAAATCHAAGPAPAAHLGRRWPVLRRMSQPFREPR